MTNDELTLVVGARAVGSGGYVECSDDGRAGVFCACWSSASSGGHVGRSRAVFASGASATTRSAGVLSLESYGGGTSSEAASTGMIGRGSVER